MTRIIPLWKSAPFVRLVLPLAAGIIFFFYFPGSVVFFLTCVLLCMLMLCLFIFLKTSLRYKFRKIQGALIFLLLFFCGGFLCNNRDIRISSNWFGKKLSNNSCFVVRLTEPPVAKTNSFKAEANVEQQIENGKAEKVCGKIILYFSNKDSSLPAYGDRLLINKGIQEIKNSGNPGGFDYAQYMRFQNIFHRAFIKQNGYTPLLTSKTNFLYRLVFASQKHVVRTIQKFVKGDIAVTGIAEALLIGYKEDLDKDTVQAYSNTGVVHIIAISGMHLGLIYVVLAWLFSKIPWIKKQTVLRVLLIISSLWLFSLITGASASVMRSAVMFTCIIIGKSFFKYQTINNAVAASAFLLLCYDPYFLWDTGFQLSYFAVIGIIWLQKVIKNLVYFKNGSLQKVWEMCAVTIAAQILTFPICLYYFHQFPNTFLVSNFICVPLSTVILFGEILLIITSAFTPLATITGKLIYVLTWLMNKIVEMLNELPGAVMQNIYATVTSTLLLYCFVCCCFAGIIRSNKRLIAAAGSFLLLFMVNWLIAFISAGQQNKMVVYHVSKYTAIDIVKGRSCRYFGDAELIQNTALKNFHLMPARVNGQYTKVIGTVTNTRLTCGRSSIRVLSGLNPADSVFGNDHYSAVLLSHNPKVNIAGLFNKTGMSILIADGSNSLWKIGQWKKECAILHLRFFNTAEEGAFILKDQN